MHASLKNNNIGYSLKAKGNLKVLGYENEIAQVLINIFSNAKDVLLEREIANPTIQIDVYKVDDYITIEVQDNAGGIHTSPIEKIFEPYVSTKHASSGTGIGLYMSKTIIEKNLKGYLSVKNGKKGAIFSITLPV
jgi:signal transduction histidine kinase